MDATFSSHGIIATLGNLLPEAGDVPSLSWAQGISKQIVAAAGYAGSQSVKLVQTPVEDGFYATACGSLPLGAFGTTFPPMIFAFPQYGSVVVYKQIFDSQANLIGENWHDVRYSRGDVFITTINNLYTAEETVDGTSYPFWRFDIYHKALRQVPAIRYNGAWVEPYYLHAPMISQWLPLKPALGGFGESLNVKSIILHWYAIGANPQI